MGIRKVPIIGYGTLQDAIDRTYAGFPSTIGTGQAEGMVLKPTIDLWARNGKRIITKIKHRDFK